MPGPTFFFELCGCGTGRFCLDVWPRAQLCTWCGGQYELVVLQICNEVVGPLTNVTTWT